MMAQSRAESTRDTYNYGQYRNKYPPNTIKVIREFERIQKKICRHKMSIMFNEICIYIYIYIYWPRVLYIYIYIYNYRGWGRLFGFRPFPNWCRFHLLRYYTASASRVRNTVINSSRGGIRSLAYWPRQRRKWINKRIAQSAGTVEDTNCVSAVG